MSYYIVVAFVFGVVAAIAAHTRGRNSLGWFIAGLLIGPFSLLVSLLPSIPREGQFKRCAVCGEVIREDAKLCRFCGRESPSAQVS